MRVLRGSRRLVGVGGGAALALGMAGAVSAGAVSAPAQARVTAILVTSHVVAGWGDNAQGQLGDGTTTSRSLSGDIRAGSDVMQVAAGNGHGLALRSDSTVWAWGDNRRGQLGNGTAASSPVPVNVTGLSQVTGISAGYDSSMATRTTPSASTRTSSRLVRHWSRGRPHGGGAPAGAGARRAAACHLDDPLAVKDGCGLAQAGLQELGGDGDGEDADGGVAGT